MPQLLIELFSEEIPARMQTGAARDLERMARERLAEAGLTPTSITTFAGPRRLTLVAEGLPAAQEDRSEEIKGPRTSAPEQALDGFLRKTGLTRDQLVERDGVFIAVIEKKGQPTAGIIAAMVDQIVRGFPWPKSMTWGTGKLRWVRPLRRILCVFDGQVVPFSIDGIDSGDITEGHRFMGPGQVLQARDFDSYRQGLLDRYVVLEAAERKRRIVEGAKAVCAAEGLELVDDEGLLEEVAGLAEWPTAILGRMDPDFLTLPPEVIRTSMRVHQRYFAVREPGAEGLAPRFLVIANIEAPDGGKIIAEGNAKVLSARLSDARFFWDEDNKPGNFDGWLKKLEGVTFHAKLGTMAERVARIAALAREIAPLVGADPDLAEKAARLAKADLASGMVGEFPEIQGIMGAYYAREAGLEPAVVEAMRDHYRPQGPGDSVPTAPVSVAVALADKLDTLVGFFAIDEKPTGSKDPYALRRAALGVLRTLIENRLRVSLPELLKLGRNQFARTGIDAAKLDQAWADIAVFMQDRTRIALKDQGVTVDVIDAALAQESADVVLLQSRVEALDAFLKTDDGANLLAGFRRAVNILRAEEKKGPLPQGAPVAVSEPAEEAALFAALEALTPKLDSALAAEDFTAAMTVLAGLRGPVDAFFEKVLVNSDVADERNNRLRLLVQARDAMRKVADFSLITG